MTESDLKSLALLAQLRGREIEDMEVSLARKEQLGQRYRKNIDTLTRLSQARAPETVADPVLSMNLGQYKGVLLTVMQEQKRDLALHEMDMAADRQVLFAAYRKNQGIHEVLDSEAARHRKAREDREQKRTDEVAGQRWNRGKM
ncbi:flagellar export protein FliJ [Paludibacterium paludis]|uniref:Flagellar FliJ protein n=1 Tax=Paludibacterium paludis TaxID=1225769 RepID=A0A918NXP9_9NEIS|nr:flagellar export protein FliJ [Paludibacterium paludis]GGY04621.1 hypothetical protein GCM10011289_03930 [Paludibacterium paludis]